MDLHLTLTDEELAAIAALLHTSPDSLDEQVVGYVLRRERDVLCSCAVRLAKGDL